MLPFKMLITLSINKSRSFRYLIPSIMNISITSIFAIFALASTSMAQSMLFVSPLYLKSINLQDVALYVQAPVEVSRLSLSYKRNNKLTRCCARLRFVDKFCAPHEYCYQSLLGSIFRTGECRTEPSARAITAVSKATVAERRYEWASLILKDLTNETYWSEIQINARVVRAGNDIRIYVFMDRIQGIMLRSHSTFKSKAGIFVKS